MRLPPAYCVDQSSAFTHRFCVAYGTPRNTRAAVADSCCPTRVPSEVETLTLAAFTIATQHMSNIEGIECAEGISLSASWFSSANRKTKQSRMRERQRLEIEKTWCNYINPMGRRMMLQTVPWGTRTMHTPRARCCAPEVAL